MKIFDYYGEPFVLKENGFWASNVRFIDEEDLMGEGVISAPYLPVLMEYRKFLRNNAEPLTEDKMTEIFNDFEKRQIS